MRTITTTTTTTRRKLFAGGRGPLPSLAALAVAASLLVSSAGAAQAATPGGGVVVGTQSVNCPTGPCTLPGDLVGVADLNADGHPDLVWRDLATGRLGALLLDRTGTVVARQTIDRTCPIPSGTENECNGTPLLADLNGDGYTDLVWWNPTSGLVIGWLLNGSGTVVGTQTLNWPCSLAANCAGVWQPMALADFNGDGHPDLLWWNQASGQLASWLLNGAGTVIDTQTVSWTCGIAGNCALDWSLLGAADMNGDGRTDLVWWNAQSGQVAYWLLNGAGGVLGTETVNWTCNLTCYNTWSPVRPADLNGDGQPDLLWRRTPSAGSPLAGWLLNPPNSAPPPQNVPCLPLVCPR